MKKSKLLYVVIQLILIVCAILVLPYLYKPINFIVFIAIIVGTICNLIFLFIILKNKK